MGPTPQEFQRRIANVIIGASALRNQGAPGVVDAARNFIIKLDLKAFAVDNEPAFRENLDEQTELLRVALPKDAQYWGAARKALNLFLGEALYHRFVCAAFQLEQIESFLEVPLDRQVADFLTSKAQQQKFELPCWSTIKELTPQDSRVFQDFASVVAKQRGWARIHLDVIAWQSQS